MKRNSYTLLLFISAILGLTACAPAATSEVKATFSPPPASVVAGGDIPLLVYGNSAFTFDLYHKLTEPDGNLFYSPYSLSSALAMTYAGARENTAKEMADTLHFLLGQEKLHSAFSQMDNELKQREQGPTLNVIHDGQLEKQQVEGFRLNIVNALWGQEGFGFLPEYLDLVKTYYGGNLNSLDFVNSPEPSRLEINSWASQQTENRINDLLPKGSISSQTRLVLTNAIYFNAHWSHEFNQKNTRNNPFYLINGDQVSVPLMYQQGQFSYMEDSNYQAIKMPYLGDELAMIVILPKQGQFEKFENSLDSNKLTAILEKMESKMVRLSLPRFKFDSSYNLSGTLNKMGMSDAFTGKADFSGITGKKDLFINMVIQKTFISVDEAGTEAAAVTAIGMAGAARPPEPVDFTANRPFIFLIQDSTGTILFAGRVLNPAS